MGHPYLLQSTRVIKTGCQAYLGFIAIFVIMYGISSGAFSPTESAAMCVGFCFFAGLLITRELSLRQLPEVLFNSGKMVGMVAPLVAVSMAMQQVLSALGIARVMNEVFGGMGYMGVLLCSMGIIFIAGMVLESVPVVTIFAPILAPVAAAAGINPIQFAMVVLVGTAIGFITPPFGLNLFVVSTVTDIPYNRLLKYVPHYLFALLAVWFSIAFIPRSPCSCCSLSSNLNAKGGTTSSLRLFCACQGATAQRSRLPASLDIAHPFVPSYTTKGRRPAASPPVFYSNKISTFCPSEVRQSGSRPCRRGRRGRP